MKYGIVDIGSNTVRLNLYKVENKDNVKSLLNKKTVAGLSSYVVDGQMTRKGADKLVRILKGYLDICNTFDIEEVHLFATAALRNALNSKDIVNYVEKEVGHKIEIISGEEEGNLGYLGILGDYEIDNGYILDIGGGSVEITVIEDKNIIFATSLTDGHLSMYKKHVDEIFPSIKEANKIKKKITKKLEKENIPVFSTPRPIYGVGGTIRACGNISQEMFDLPTNSLIYSKTIRSLKDKLLDKDKETINTTLQVVPERIHTITPGIIILDTVFSFLNASELNISKKGVREGYLSKNLK